MFLKTFLEKTIINKPLTEGQRFAILKLDRIEPRVEKYLSKKLENLTITIDDYENANVLKLMEKGLLEGWCWQTTDTSILFFEDTDYIERGTLTFSEGDLYWHSWICFSLDGLEYVFDPCFAIVCPKKKYAEVFETKVYSVATAKQVRMYLLSKLNAHSLESITERNVQTLIENGWYDFAIRENDNFQSPMFGNNAHYHINVDTGKIKQLSARLYKN